MSDVIDLTNDSSDSESQSDDSNETQAPGLSDVSRTQLQVAVATVAERRLREIVARLVNTDRSVANAMYAELVTVLPPAAGDQEGIREEVPRWMVCANCEEEFDASIEPGSDEEDPECIYHPGELEVDFESFADWDEDCHGPMDTRENREQYPGNFKWTCCEKDGTTDGCQEGDHVAQHPPKRRKL